MDRAYNTGRLCICGKRFDVDHAISCQRGGFICRRHDELKKLIGHIAGHLYHDVEIEPKPLPMTERYPPSICEPTTGCKIRYKHS